MFDFVMTVGSDSHFYIILWPSDMPSEPESGLRNFLGRLYRTVALKQSHYVFGRNPVSEEGVYVIGSLRNFPDSRVLDGAPYSLFGRDSVSEEGV